MPEITVTQYGAYFDEKSFKDYLLNVPGEVYDRNPVLFRKAMRLMQKYRDIKGEKQIYNRCVNAGTNRVAREYVLPVLLGASAIPVALEYYTAFAVYMKASTWIRMGVKWTTQVMMYGINEVDYVSVVAEGFTLGGSALSALIEIRPISKEGPKFKKGFIDKSFGETSMDIVTHALGAGITRSAAGIAMADKKAAWEINLTMGLGTYYYTQYQLITSVIIEEIKNRTDIRKDETE